MSFTFIHTADWHLGQTFNGYSRDAEHAAFFQNLLRILRERRPDALIVAGDIFDGVNPSAASQALYYRFLASAAQDCPDLRIVITAGNHDAATRLEAPADVLRALRVTVVGTVARDDAGAIDYAKFLVPLHDRAGELAAVVTAVPFLRRADVPSSPGGDDDYLDGIRALYAEATATAARFAPGVPLIATGHLHMQDGAVSEGAERPLVIGNAEAVRTDTFPRELAYVALGHLHQPQSLDGGRIRYCGSPIPLSFSEIHYKHGVLAVTLDAKAAPVVEAIPLPRFTDLVRIPATGALPLDALKAAIAAYPFAHDLPPERHPYLELRVRDDGPDPKRAHALREALRDKPVRLVAIKPVAPATAAPDAAIAPGPHVADAGDLAALDPAEMLMRDHRERFGVDPAPEILAALRELLADEHLA